MPIKRSVVSFYKLTHDQLWHVADFAELLIQEEVIPAGIE
jgi:hypothetical protein